MSTDTDFAIEDRWLRLAPDATLVVDQSGRIVRANGLAERLLGYPPGTLAVQPLEMLVPARLRGSHGRHVADHFRDPRHRPMGTGPILWGLRRDGSEFAAANQPELPAHPDRPPRPGRRSRRERRSADIAGGILPGSNLARSIPPKSRESDRTARLTPAPAAACPGPPPRAPVGAGWGSGGDSEENRFARTAHVRATRPFDQRPNGRATRPSSTPGASPPPRRTLHVGSGSHGGGPGPARHVALPCKGRPPPVAGCRPPFFENGRKENRSPV